jgi:hypothetical protein
MTSHDGNAGENMRETADGRVALGIKESNPQTEFGSGILAIHTYQSSNELRSGLTI